MPNNSTRLCLSRKSGYQGVGGSVEAAKWRVKGRAEAKTDVSVRVLLVLNYPPMATAKKKKNSSQTK
jgi:hypothetical protein